MKSSFSMFLLYHAYIYLELLILTCTIYILAPVDAPIINEFPICLECKFIEYQDNEYGCGVIGKVVNVTADESVMVDGKIDMSKVNAIAFDPYTHGYYKVTERVGEAFRDGLKLKK